MTTRGGRASARAGLHPRLLFFFISFPLLALPPCANTPAYTPCDITFELPGTIAKQHPNPYATLDIWLELRAPDFKTYRFPGFTDDGRTMVFRVNPVMPGKWIWRISGPAGMEDKTGDFAAVAGDSLGFIHRQNAHHWQYSEQLKPHLYMGADFTTLDALNARAAQKFTHISTALLSPDSFTAPDRPNPAAFRASDERVTAIASKNMIADLILAPSPAVFTSVAESPKSRERLLLYLIARYSAFNLTWQLAGEWESAPGARAILKEIGLALKKLDPYSHPRSTRSRTSSSPLGPDGWMDHSIYGFSLPPVATDALQSVEHQTNNVPQIALLDAKLPPDEFRKRLWNSTVNGAYPVLAGDAPPDSPNAKTMAAWFEFMSTRVRYWDVQPFFDLDGARAIGIAGLRDEDNYDVFQAVEFIVYIEKPGPVELRIQKHTYDIWWLDPLTGECKKEKKDWKGDIWKGEPPDKSHDWVLHLSRDGRKEGMLRSYKFESWPIPVQEPERNAQKAPFDLATPAPDTPLTVGQPVQYSIKLKRQTGGTRRMTYLISGEIVRDAQGNRILAAGSDGTFTIPPDILTGGPGIINLRVAALNAPGKLYLIDYVFSVSK